MFWQISSAAALIALLAAHQTQIASIDAGQWETTISMDLPGLGGETKSTSSYCVSEAEAAAGPVRMFQPEASQCDVLSHSYGEGTMALEMLCKADGGEIKITTMGSFTATTYEMTSLTEATFGGQPMTMNSKITGHYVGPCHESG